jgi:hypothetical protein
MHIRQQGYFHKMGRSSNSQQTIPQHGAKPFQPRDSTVCRKRKPGGRFLGRKPPGKTAVIQVLWNL